MLIQNLRNFLDTPPESTLEENIHHDKIYPLSITNGMWTRRCEQASARSERIIHQADSSRTSDTLRTPSIHIITLLHLQVLGASAAPGLPLTPVRLTTPWAESNYPSANDSYFISPIMMLDSLVIIAAVLEVAHSSNRYLQRCVTARA